MTTALALTRPDQSTGFTREQIDLIKNTIAKGSTDDELSLFMQTCTRLGLDPFAKQIHLVKRYDSQLQREIAQSQVSIDGFRLVAERTRQYRGQTAPQWCGKDGIWKDVWLLDGAPAAARCGVYREGFREPLYRVARYASYVQTRRDGSPNRMWATMPDVMLSKCAEALALRAAFPNELSGVYAEEEMEQADSEERPKLAASNTQQRAAQAPAVNPEAAKLVEGLVNDAAKVPVERLLEFYEHATNELKLAGATDQQKIMVSSAFGERCKALGVKPKDVVAGKAAQP